ncbi:glycoside hydrolase family 30 protein [Onishia taeanensis]
MLLQGFETSAAHPAMRERQASGPAGDRAGLPAIRLNPAVRYQGYLGSGGAFTEASAVNYALLSEAEKRRFMQGYFCPEQGHGYSLCRLHMNSCDFGLGNWACQPSEDAPFSLARYREAIFPMIRDAQAMLGRPIDLLVSPWSPPAWMKTNGEMNHGGRLRPECRAQWAHYFVRFLRGLQEEGLSVWGVTVQNEPEAVQRWDSCLYSATEERNFIRDHLGPALREAGLGDVRIVCWDHNRDHLYERAEAILGDPETAPFVWGAGYHWYMDDCFDNVQAVHDAFPDKGLLFTEGCQEGGPHRDSWSVAERYARSMINDLRRWTQGWIDWNLALDEDGGPNHVGNLCSAPALVDPGQRQFRWQPSYHALGHVARFVPPGSVRILSAAGLDALAHVAFVRPDGGLVLVVLNTTEADIDWSLVIGGDAWTLTTPAHALQTWWLTAP